MALTTTVARALASPARPLTVAPRLSAMAAPSRPLAATGARPGASGLTVTASVAVVVVLRLPSASRVVAATLRVKLASAAGVTVRPARFQLCTSTEVLPALAVKVWVPSLSVAPSGMALTTTVARALASPARPLTVAPRLSAMAAPSRPLAATGARPGASGLTVTASLAVVVVLRLPSASRVVAATLRAKLAAAAGGGGAGECCSGGGGGGGAAGRGGARGAGGGAAGGGRSHGGPGGGGGRAGR